ncbi:unnamed protein product [Lactuca saligna]|uniref:Uncharacterized protein n=1 Tax=Lactuca saligna TaxID=75948 RepID=A0AA35UZB4_LACSI|nr:unnamed protein product [Lactuca saligna]
MGILCLGNFSRIFFIQFNRGSMLSQLKTLEYMTIKNQWESISPERAKRNNFFFSQGLSDLSPISLFITKDKSQAFCSLHNYFKQNNCFCFHWILIQFKNWHVNLLFYPHKTTLLI